MANTAQKYIVNPPKELRAEIQAGLLEFGKVKIVGLGIFEVKRIAPRRGRNPKTGKIVMMPAYKKIKFRPTATLKQLIV